MVRAAFSVVGDDFGVLSREAEPRRTSPEDSASQGPFWGPHLSVSHASLVKMQIPGPALLYKMRPGAVPQVILNPCPGHHQRCFCAGPGWAVESESLSGSLSPLVSSSREGPPSDSDRVLRAHAAHLPTPGAQLPKTCLLSLPQVLPVPDACGPAPEPVELWGTRRHRGVM